MSNTKRITDKKTARWIKIRWKIYDLAEKARDEIAECKPGAGNIDADDFDDIDDLYLSFALVLRDVIDHGE